MKNNIFYFMLKSTFLTGVLCTIGFVFAAESRISSGDYGTFAYTIIMTHPWSDSMKNMIKIAWDGWSKEQRLAIIGRMQDRGIPLTDRMISFQEKMISPTDFRTVAYINIMNQPWMPSMANLITNCWNGWSEKQRSDITRRVRDQGISIENISKNPKEQMLRGVEDK